MNISRKIQQCIIIGMCSITVFTVIYVLIKFVIEVHRWNWNY